jgi:hypothetical protein
MFTKAGKDVTAEAVVPEISPTLLCALEMKPPENPTEYNKIAVKLCSSFNLS